MENQLLDSDMLGNKDGKSLNELLMNGYETNSAEYIRKGYEIFKENAGGFIGFIILAFFARIIGGIIPIIGSIISIFLIPLTIGAYIVAKKISKNEHYEFSNFFDGYQKLGPLIGSAFIQGFIVVGIILIFFIPFFLIHGFNLSSLDNSNFNDSGFMLLMGLIFILMLVVIFIFVAWTLSSQLIVFNNNSPWEAMEISRKIVSKKYFNWLGFILLIWLVNVAGALCLLVGLLITVPTTLCALYVAYDDVVGMNLKE